MTFTISVVICSHNPRREYFRRVIDALQHQTFPMSKWELLLIDNASNESLNTLYDLDWHPHYRYVREDKLGTMYARLRGIQESQGDLIIYVDDDNVLNPDYLSHAQEIAEQYPLLGAWGGQVYGEYEQEPEAWARPLLPLLAISQVERDQWSNLNQQETLPVGAGMCFRRSVAQKYVALVMEDPRRFGLGPRGTLRLSCEDFDIALSALDIGLGLGQFCRLKLTHLIPAGRLNEHYFLNLVTGIVYSRTLLNAIRGVEPEKVPLRRAIRYFLSSLLMHPRDRRFLKATKRAIALANQEIAAMQMQTFSRDHALLFAPDVHVDLRPQKIEH
jgi:glycosyltransferase involved in cell wall biosynthesis